MAKMSLTPKPTAADFIKGANQVEGDYPWNAPGVREDVFKSVPLRLTEPDKLMLEWVSAKTGIPQQEIIRRVFLPHLHALVEEHTTGER